MSVKSVVNRRKNVPRNSVRFGEVSVESPCNGSFIATKVWSDSFRHHLHEWVCLMFHQSMCIFVFAFPYRRKTSTLILGFTPHTYAARKLEKKVVDFWVTALNISLMRARNSKMVIGSVPSSGYRRKGIMLTYKGNTNLKCRCCTKR